MLHWSQTESRAVAVNILELKYIDRAGERWGEGEEAGVGGAGGSLQYCCGCLEKTPPR